MFVHDPDLEFVNVRSPTATAAHIECESPDLLFANHSAVVGVPT